MQALPLVTNIDHSRYHKLQYIILGLRKQGYSCASVKQHIDACFMFKDTPLRDANRDSVDRGIRSQESHKSPVVVQQVDAQPLTAIDKSGICATLVALPLLEAVGADDIELRRAEAAVDPITATPVPTSPRLKRIPSEDQQQQPILTLENEVSLSGEGKQSDTGPSPNGSCTAKVPSLHSVNGSTEPGEVTNIDNCRTSESQTEITASGFAENRWCSFDDYFGMRHYQQNVALDEDHVEPDPPENISPSPGTEREESANTAATVLNISARNAAPQSPLSPDSETEIVSAKYQCRICRVSSDDEDQFLSHLTVQVHRLLLAKHVFLRCTGCSFKSRQPMKMGGHIIAYQSRNNLNSSITHAVARN
ncbi:uncharacterized protein LOC129592335 [Paramacrobiotus metropolitanus]|uniref:uncharacterized protein LOC129592335 n=1 Tax=Paramacrobiotus metropolitanus TaxID=2943436 RepID=UPI0024456B7F|nr:uncharacterized protein LOC129592335 [Paramacrobiotus metropolitanus]